MNRKVVPLLHTGQGRSPTWQAYRLQVGGLSFAYPSIVFLLVVVLATLFVYGTYGTQDDDGYIFYTYARNLAEGHGLSFNPGEVSYGITSGAWVGLLSLVHWLVRADIVLEAQWLGIGLCALSAGLWAWAVARWSGRPLLGLVGAAIYALELDAMKASLSGLETGLNLALFAALACALADLRFDRPVVPGLLFGMAVLTRPDNAVLLLPVLGVAIASRLPLRSLISKLGIFGVTAFASLIPWYGWLWISTGTPIPPTQTGKLLVFLPMNLGITLGDYQELGPVGRFFFGLDVLLKYATGGGPVRVAVLSVAALSVLCLLLRLRPDTRRYALWPALLIGCVMLQAIVYAWTFPLLKMRYLINMLPVGLVLAPAALGLLWLQYRPGPVTWAKTANLPRFAQVTAAMLVLGGLAIAGLFYAPEVKRQIESYSYNVAVQDVRSQVGAWLKKNTAADSVVALEPIGSVAFYSDRQILDLGGLTDRSIWPALAGGYQDGKAIARLLVERHADYVVDYTDPTGIGGVSSALPHLQETSVEAIIESDTAGDGAREQYGSYTIYKLRNK